LELILIRHGRVDSGEKRFNEAGRFDQPLGELGREQSHALVSRFEDQEISAIYASELIRTRQTAEPLAKSLGVEIRIHPGLNEVYLGEYEGRSFSRMLQERDEVYMRFLETRRWSEFPGAEPDDSVRKRVSETMEELAELHPKQRVIAFTHGGIINAALAVVTQSPTLVLVSPENASVTSIYLRPRPPLVVTVNDTAHLPDRDPLKRTPRYFFDAVGSNY
jgi:probable phosphoglycerate mutase